MMMKTFISMLIVFTALSASAQKTKSGEDLSSRIKQIEDKMTLRELVDNFSNLADVKDVASQVLLFTEDATVESIVNGNAGSILKGRAALQNAFAPFLANFQTVYHSNGQHMVKVDGDHATGILYCTVTLIGMQESKRMKTTMGVSYTDEYIRLNGIWLIAKRKSVFNWQDVQEMK